MRRQDHRIDRKKMSCLDCQWTQLLSEPHAKPFYWCVKREKDVTDRLLWHRVCADFVPR